MSEYDGEVWRWRNPPRDHDGEVQVRVCDGKVWVRLCEFKTRFFYPFTTWPMPVFVILFCCSSSRLMFLYPLYPLYFFLFCGRQGCFPLLLRIPQFVMRKSDLRSSFGTKCLVKLFLSFFCKICFYWTKGHLRCWTIKRSFDFERWEMLRRWTINDFLFLKGEKR